jgi:adenylate cyclase
MVAIAIWNESQKKHGGLVISIGIGIAMGEVIFGVIGNADRLEYTVIGEAANLAAKLEKQNKEEASHALTTMDMFTEAQKQHYVCATGKKRVIMRNVADVEGSLELVVLA